MLLGIGIDMIEVKRIEEKIAKGKGFRELVFSPAEILYCESKTNRYQHYAARFAAKEALLKAFGIGLITDYQLNEMEIVNDEIGKPSFNFTGGTLTLIRQKDIKQIHVSLTHLKEIASAVVTIEI